MQRGVRVNALLIVEPLLIHGAQFRGLVAVARFKPLGKDALQHRQREKGAGDLQQREPFSVMLCRCGGHSCYLRNSGFGLLRQPFWNQKGHADWEHARLRVSIALADGRLLRLKFVWYLFQPGLQRIDVAHVLVAFIRVKK